VSTSRHLALSLHIFVSSFGVAGCADVSPPTEVRIGALEGDSDNPIAVGAPATVTPIALTANTSIHYAVSGTPALGLRVAAHCDQSFNLLVRKDSTTAAIVASKYNGTLSTVLLTAAQIPASSSWFIELHANAQPADCAMRVDPFYSTDLTWDDGATLGGAAPYASWDTVGGDYLFKMTAQTSAWGAWRHLLAVGAGEADLYLQQNAYPADSTTHKSTKVGGDAVVLAANDFAPAQTWYLRVHALPDSAWSVVSGDRRFDSPAFKFSADYSQFIRVKRFR
jgi:hypothetical protein